MVERGCGIGGERDRRLGIAGVGGVGGMEVRFEVAGGVRRMVEVVVGERSGSSSFAIVGVADEEGRLCLPGEVILPSRLGTGCRWHRPFGMAQQGVVGSTAADWVMETQEENRVMARCVRSGY